jgi:hypothetical protein
MSVTGLSGCAVRLNRVVRVSPGWDLLDPDALADSHTGAANVSSE